MSDVEIVRNVGASEIRSWAANMTTTFLEDPRSENVDRFVEAFRREWSIIRSWGARADGRWVATLATEPHVLTIPGPHGSTGDLDVDGLTAVTVNATHRRRGLLTRMLTEAMQSAAERGDPVSVLIAAEWPIYGRFGYAPATLEANYTYFPRRSAVTPGGDGRVRQVEAAELGELAPEIFERARRRRAGQIDRRGDWWPRRLGLDGYQPFKRGNGPNLFVHESSDGPDGVLFWSAAREFDIDGSLGSIEVGDLIAASDLAYRNLWAYLGGIDVIDEIAVPRRAVDEPVRWLLPDGRALRQTYRGDGLWLRLIDVPAALSARSYRIDAQIVLEVVDDDIGGYASGRYLLECVDGVARCERTADRAHVQLSQRVLAGCYLGAFSLRELAVTGQVVELAPGAINRADLMFSTELPPWNTTGF